MKSQAVWGVHERLAGAFDLPLLPEERFYRLLEFAGLGEAEARTMRLDAERLLDDAADWVRQAYDALARYPDTAKALGWETHVLESSLYLRRAFFSAWLARTIGVDTSKDFARYLHHAGRVHAGFGPEAREVPEEWVGMAFAFILGKFSEKVAPERLPLWGAYLKAQEGVMLRGQALAEDLKKGAVPVRFSVMGVARRHWKTPIDLRLEEATLLRLVEKVFAFAPELVDAALEPVPAAEEAGLWLEEVTRWRFRPGWTLLVEGRDARHLEGLKTPLAPGARVELLPPGR